MTGRSADRAADPTTTAPDGGRADGRRPATDGVRARVAGAAYLVTFVTSVPALALKVPFLDGRGAASSAQWAALLEVVLALACVATAVALHPVLRRRHPVLALGFVASRVLEASGVLLGVVALLALVSVRAAGTSPDVDRALVALHDAAFLVGPGLLPAVNAALLGTTLLRTGLVPRVIPLVGLCGAPLLVASATGSVLGAVDQVSPLAGLAALPVGLWELSLGLWLVVRGLRTDHAVDRRSRPSRGALG